MFQLSAFRKFSDSSLSLSAFRSFSFSLLPLPQPPEQKEQGDQRKRKEDGTTLMVDGAIDHMRANFHAKNADHPDSKAIARNG
jgi:hypothetical protein